MITLSPSSLSDFAKCRRCWWLDKVQKIAWPRGVFPSLQGGIDRVLKDWYDCYRHTREYELEHGGLVMPPELDADGRLQDFMLYWDTANLKRWRFWRTGLRAEVAPGVIISGAIDDLLAPFKEGDPYAMLDYKTRGVLPKEGDTEKYYGIQANCYSLMLDANGMKTGGKGYFVYYWPAKEGVRTGSMPTQTSPIIDFSFETEIVTEIGRAHV